MAGILLYVLFLAMCDHPVSWGPPLSVCKYLGPRLTASTVYDAIVNDDLRGLKNYAERNESFLTSNSSLVVTAAANNKPDIVSWLVNDKNMSPNVRDRSNSSSLDIAAKFGYVDVARVLLGDSRTEIHPTGPTPSLSPLCSAALHNHSRIVSMLLLEFSTRQTPTDPRLHQCNENLENVLHVAIAAGHASVVEALLDSSSHQPSNELTALCRARRADGLSPLHLAHVLNDTVVIEILSRHGLRAAEPNFLDTEYRKMLAFNRAVKRLSTEFLKIIHRVISSVFAGVSGAWARVKAGSFTAWTDLVGLMRRRCLIINFGSKKQQQAGASKIQVPLHVLKGLEEMDLELAVHPVMGTAGWMDRPATAHSPETSRHAEPAVSLWSYLSNPREMIINPMLVSMRSTANQKAESSRRVNFSGAKCRCLEAQYADWKEVDVKSVNFGKWANAFTTMLHFLPGEPITKTTASFAAFSVRPFNCTERLCLLRDDSYVVDKTPMVLSGPGLRPHWAPLSPDLDLTHPSLYPRPTLLARLRSCVQSFLRPLAWGYTALVNIVCKACLLVKDSTVSVFTLLGNVFGQVLSIVRACLAAALAVPQLFIRLTCSVIYRAVSLFITTVVHLFTAIYMGISSLVALGIDVVLALYSSVTSTVSSGSRAVYHMGCGAIDIVRQNVFLSFSLVFAGLLIFMCWKMMETQRRMMSMLMARVSYKLEVQNRKIEVSNQLMVRLNRRMSLVSWMIVELDQKVMGLDQGVLELNQRLSGFDYRFVQQSQKFVRAEQKMTEVARKVVGLDGKMTEFSQKIEELRDSVFGAHSQMSDMAEELNELTAELAALKSIIALPTPEDKKPAGAAGSLAG